MNDTIILLFIALIVYGAVIFGQRIINRRLEKLRHCSKERLPSALFTFILVKRRVTLAEISNHFFRPMDEIKKVLQRSTYFKMVEASFDKKDSGWEIWSIG